MVARLAIFREADEARGQQCCGPDGAGHFNEQPYPGRWCIGSSCMAWRWFETNVRNDSLPHPNLSIGPGELVPSGEVYGFCGLAGDPRAPRN